jgi:hypothetical protein
VAATLRDSGDKEADALLSAADLDALYAIADGAVPVNEVGVPVPVSVKRWWCESHRDQAAPGDMSIRSSGIRISESGALVPIDEGEIAKAEAEAEIRRQQHERRLAERKLETERLHLEEEARDAAFRSALPESFRNL